MSGLIHKTAIIHESAEISKNVSIGPYSYIGKNVKIGSNTNLMGFNSIQDGASVGKNCLLYPYSNLCFDCVLEDGVSIYPHTIIGSEGFGYATNQKGEHIHIPQIGSVLIKKNSSIGPQSQIDRAALELTSIGEKSQISSHGHIAHNVSIGDNALIYYDFIVAGSTKIGKNFTALGSVSINGHIELTDNVFLDDMTGVHGSETTSGKYQGFPHQEASLFQEREEAIKDLSKMRKTINIYIKNILSRAGAKNND